MSNPKRTEIIQNPAKHNRMLSIGEQRGLPKRNATVAKAFIDLILKIDGMEEVQTLLKKEGIDTFTMIEQAVKQYIRRSAY